MIARLVLLVLLLASPAWATVHNVTTAGELTTALAAAVAGDEIVLANGTYSGTFATTNAGTSGNKITLRAANPRQAILQNTTTCSINNVGLILADAHWVVDGLRIQQQGLAVRVDASNVTIKNSIITNFSAIAIRVMGSVDAAIIENNVIGHGATCVADGRSPAGLELTNGTATDIDGADFATIRNNIIFATGDNGYTAGSKEGYGVIISNNSDDNLFQGNMVFANGGKGVLRILAGQTMTGANNNVIRDSAFLWGEGENSTGDCKDDSNQYLNNLMVDVYQAVWATKGNGGTDLGSLRGNHTLSGNTFYMGPFARIGAWFGTGGEPFCDNSVINYKINNVLTNNLWYSPDAVSNFHQIFGVPTQSTSGVCTGGVCPNFATNDYNLFWQNHATESAWINNNAQYSPGANDIKAFASQPIFTNAAAGDFSLAAGSPGLTGASDGGPIGVRYNAFLPKARIAQAFALATAQNDGLGTSTSFTVSSNHYYQVYFWIPSSGACAITETFTVEGTELSRDISTLNTSTWTSTPARWITLGRHIATDGTLNVSWTTSSCAEKIFIRQLPTVDEAYAWLSLSDAPTPGEPGKLELKVFRSREAMNRRSPFRLTRLYQWGKELFRAGANKRSSPVVSAYPFMLSGLLKVYR